MTELENLQAALKAHQERSDLLQQSRERAYRRRGWMLGAIGVLFAFKAAVGLYHMIYG